MAKSKPQTCDLCGQEIKGPGVRESFDGGERIFCSEGCARAYRDMHQHSAA
ncbi:MAG: hypothetical protein ACK2U2_06090, partial [Anaerolineae bacterium]